MTRASPSLLLQVVFSFVIGLAVSFLMLYLCLTDLEIVCTIQMPAYRIGEAFGFNVHGGLYLFGVLLNALFFGALCFCGLFFLQRITRKSG